MNAVWFAVILSLAAPPETTPSDVVVLTKAKYREFLDAADRAKRLETALHALTERVAFLEERAGMRPLGERTLDRAHDLGRVRFGRSVRQISTVTDPGRKRDLGALVGGQRGTVVAWWATWCKPCTSPEELRRLAQLRESLARYGLELVSIAVDDTPTVRKDPRAATWVYPYWQVKDGHLDLLPEALMRRGGVGLPLFLVLDSTGRIRWIRRKALDAATVEDLVTAAVNIRPHLQ